MLLLEELEDTERTKLNGFLNREPGAPIGELTPIFARPVAYTLEEIYALAESRQEEILIADAQVEQAGLERLSGLDLTQRETVAVKEGKQ